MKGRRSTSRSPVPAKIAIPRLTEPYDRPRVFRALDQARRKKVVWISAPAGAGKTSAVVTYLASRRLPTLWYNVDTRDRDAANLFHYLTMAAQLARPRRKLGLPAFTAENQHGVAAFAKGFFEKLYEELPSPSAVVLDDYHDARSELFDEVVREATAALPKGVTTIIVSRAPPPPLLMRHVASQTIALVGMDELRLTAKDVAGLVRVRRPDLRGAALKRALPRITDLAHGWAAALTLLLLDRSVTAFDPVAIEHFSERLFDYFATEVLDKATAVQRELLLKTAVAPSVTPALAVQLSGVPDAPRILADLDRRSFLVQRLGDSGAYRFHPLLRSFLLRRAETDFGTAAVRHLHRQAAQTFLESGLIDEAMDQFQASDDVVERTRLLLDLAPAYIGTGRSRTISAWIAGLPATWVGDNGWLLYWRGVSSFGHWEEKPLEYLERAYNIFERNADAQGIYLTWAAAVQGVVQDGTDFTRLDRWLDRFESLERAGVACPEPFLPMVATGMMLASAFRRLQAAHNRKWVDRAMALGEKSHDFAHRIMNGGFAAMYFALYERPARAKPILQKLRDLAQGAEPSILLVITIGQAEATAAWLEGDNERCVAFVREALATAARTGVFVWNDYLLGLGVGACLGLEDFGAVQEMLQPMADIARQRGGFPASTYHGHVSWDAQDRGDASSARHHAELANAIAEKEGPPFGHTVTLILLAQAQWMAGRPREAVAALAQAKDRAEEAACALHLHTCYLIESDLYWDEDRPRALSCLRKSFGYADESGYYNAIGLNRRTLERAVVRALEHGITVEYVLARIRKNGLRPADLPPSLEAWPWRYRFRLFASFDMVACAESPPFRNEPFVLRGMPRRLLEALLVFGGRGVRDLQIIDALWPDAEGDAGRRIFDTTLHRLRRQLGDADLLRMNDGRLYLDERRCWLDTWAFDDLAAEAERQIASEGPASCLADLALRIGEIYRGQVLADDVAGSPWAARSRAQYASRFLHLAQSLGRALEHAGKATEAAALYSRSSDHRASPAP